MPLQDFPPAQTVINPVFPGGTQGNILFFGAGATVSQSSSLFWDNVNLTVQQVGAASANIASRWRVTGDAANRFQITAGASLSWGDGTNPVDATLARLASNPGVLILTNPAGGTTSALAISNASGSVRDIRFQTNSVDRWVTRANQTVESGSNVGSDYQILSRDDAGVLLRADATITRSTGLWTFAGSLFAPTVGVGQAISGATILGVVGSETIASGASATWDGVNVITSNATLTGNTSITTATGFNLFSVAQPNISSASALTITSAATFSILGAPVAGGAGPTTITNAYALWVQSGNARFAGQILAKPGTAASPSYCIFGQSDGMYSRTATILDWAIGGAVMLELLTNVLQMNSNGNIGFNSGTVGSGSFDTALTRSAVGVFLAGSTANGVKIGYDGTNCKLAPSAGQLYFAAAALATSATTGYMTIPSCAGTPTGVPANIPTGQIPMVYDSTNNFLYVYNGGWKKSSVYA